MSDHLWPARAGYLRVGTPVVLVGRYHGVVLDVDITRDGARVCAPGPDMGDEPSECWWPMQEVSLDLRDPTARAHAAWRWTHYHGRQVLNALHESAMRRIGSHKTGDSERLQAIEGLKALNRACRALYRMADGNPSVTVAEAREALAWAEEVSDE